MPTITFDTSSNAKNDSIDEHDGNENTLLSGHSRGEENDHDSDIVSQEGENEDIPLLNKSQGSERILVDGNDSESCMQTAVDDSMGRALSVNDDDKNEAQQKLNSEESISGDDTEEKGSSTEENNSLKNVRVIHVKCYDDVSRDSKSDVGNTSTDCLNHDVLLDQSNFSACENEDNNVDQIQNSDGSLYCINDKENSNDCIAQNKLDVHKTVNNNDTENSSIADDVSEIDYTIHDDFKNITFDNTDECYQDMSGECHTGDNFTRDHSTSGDLTRNAGNAKSSPQDALSNNADDHDGIKTDSMLSQNKPKEEDDDSSTDIDIAKREDVKYLQDTECSCNFPPAGMDFSDDSQQSEIQCHQDKSEGSSQRSSHSLVLDEEGAEECEGGSAVPTAQSNDTNKSQTDQTNKEVFLEVDPEVVGYIYGTTNYKDQFDSLLDQQGIQFDWTSGSSLAVIKYNGDDKEERLKTVKSFLKTFGKVDMSVKKDIWNSALPEIFNYRSRQVGDPPTIQILEDQSAVRIISSNTDIAYHKNCVRTILTELLKEATFECEHIPGHSKEYLELLKMINFVENNIQHNFKCKEVKVAFDEENLKIWLKGPKEQLKIATEEFLEQELAISKRDLELSQECLKVLNTTKGKEAIKNALEHNSLRSVIEFRHVDRHSEKLCATVLGETDEHAEKAVSSISEIVTKEEIQVDEDNIALRSTPEWRELCKSIIAETEVLIQYDGLSDISVVGWKNDVISSITKLRQFLNKYSLRRGIVTCPSADIKQFIRKNREEDLQSIETGLAKYDVKISDGEGKQFYISGREKGFEQSKTLLTDVINKIVVRNFAIEQPGLRKTFERRKGDEFIEMVAKKQKCLSRTKTKFQQNDEMGREGTSLSAATETDSDSDDDKSDLMTSVGEPFFVTAQRQKISWKIGNIVEEQVHTVVSPEGECSKAIRKDNPAMSQYLGHLLVGEISLSPGFNLPCCQVIHACCSGWNGGQGETSLRAIVQKSLHKVVETGGHSIAFPIIGTGILNFPPKESCRIMLDQTLAFCRNNPRSCLKDIRFIVFHGNQGIIEAFRQEIRIVQKREGKQAMSSTGIQNDEKMSSLSIEVVIGDLIREKTDAIVNMIGPDMNMNNAGELSKSIAVAAGSQVQNECRRLGKQNPGAAVITNGGNLPASHVIHLIPGFGSFKDNIPTCLENCLQLAEMNGLRSISLPAVGTGRYCISVAASASIIFQALNKFEGRFVNIQHVRIVTPKYSVRRVFLQEKEKRRPIPLLRQTPATTCKEDSNGVKIKLHSGDLTHENTDAIFNIINTDMTLSNAGELSKAIASAAGQQVEDECKGLGPQRGGTAVVTSGGNLKARHIVHLIPFSSDKQHLQNCLEEGLRLAERAGFRSISLPAIGSGGYGMSAVVSANMIFQALENICATCVNIQEVRIVLLNDQLVEAFEQEQKTRQRGDRHKLATRTVRQSVKVWITGNDEESVTNVATEIRSGFTGDCLTEEVKNDGVFILSESPKVNFFLDEAFKADVEMSIDDNRITLRGDEREVRQLALKIYQEISQLKQEQEEKQQDENALLYAKTTDWAYVLNEEKSHFDYKTNYIIEMAHKKEEPSVKVPLRGDEFVLDLKAKMGYGQRNGEQITLIRQLKQAEEIPLPEHWSAMKPEQNVVTVELDTDSSEYEDVSKQFYNTAVGATITRIDRVQNPYKYRSYILRKDKMDKDNGGTNERQLFHGTSSESAASINEQGFNRNFCGKHGSLYGQGVYFARDASFSVDYTEKEDVERRMYLARVLVGHYCEGKHEMIVPPPKNPDRPAILYDSTVNKSVNPAIFVAFSDEQCYPEYLITFQYVPPPPPE